MGEYHWVNHEGLECIGLLRASVGRECFLLDLGCEPFLKLWALPLPTPPDSLSEMSLCRKCYGPSKQDCIPIRHTWPCLSWSQPFPCQKGRRITQNINLDGRSFWRKQQPTLWVYGLYWSAAHHWARWVGDVLVLFASNISPFAAEEAGAWGFIMPLVGPFLKVSEEVVFWSSPLVAHALNGCALSPLSSWLPPLQPPDRNGLL